MEDESSLFLASIKDRTTQLLTVCPGFEVFALTESKLLECIADLRFDSFSGADFTVMHELREELEKAGTEKAHWAITYIDLWYCDNFHGRYWSELIKQDRQNVRFAIQAALVRVIVLGE